MKAEKKKLFARWRRHKHLRKRLIGTAEKPRLNVFRSCKHIYCQIIDDTHVDKAGNRSGKTLVSCSTVDKDIRKDAPSGSNIAAATLVGQQVAKLAKEKGITKIAFDRGGYKFHGRVKALADAARKEGLEF